MSKRPLESLKSTADKLADLIYNGSQDVEKIETLERELGIIDAPEAPGKSTAGEGIDTPKAAEGFGVWKSGIFRGKKCFIRERSFTKEWGLWANKHRIPTKKGQKRVLFLGESVARGFLFDPFFTPASYLEGLLKNKSQFADGMEVIDLAKTNLQMDELKKLCTSSLVLKPDMVAIFAGNNWGTGINFSPEEWQWIWNTLRNENAIEDLKLFLEDKDRQLVQDFITHTDEVYKANGIPWMLIVPEFNLMDWRGLENERILQLPRGETAKWAALKEDALKAMDSGEIEQAEKLVMEMIGMNETSRLAYELIAQCKVNNNREKEAGHYLRLAQNTRIYSLSTIPGITSIIQDTMAKEAKRLQIPVVDLRSEFRSYGVPGKELFIDYCHLTAEGIQVSMEAVAQKILLLLGQKPVTREELRAAGLPPKDEVKAKAHFFAAIHNAHNGQPYENLYHHCKEALDLSDNLNKLFLSFIDMANRRTPWVVTRACEELASGGELSQYETLLQPQICPIMDLNLVDAMVAALKTKNIDKETENLKLRIDEHGVQNGKVNLLDTYYHRVSYRTFTVPTKGYYRAFDYQSRFFLVVHEDGAKLELNLTGRTPLIKNGDHSISVKINDSEPLLVTASDTWKNYSLQLPAKAVKKGVNNIVIQWPMDVDIEKNWDETAAVEKKINRLMYPVYGELHMLTASKID
ncbi:MAG: hypothetical protein GY757_11655 [bacterium]|nr:hypothetical protein [bacterium]